ncbi:flagellar motor switch protein FliG [Tardibacter chloracetimidivorans]|uniref:Flagellar motor switch protein FliG n=1 Tax=Tardibacter chloracetimidivorans TaxID=1921510 RepID=A0A1L3ZYV8_9SPHN|nr:flagellar motor switch protein FliG [Tardibacter chloracetimidivorans]API60795.1 flagellar motor switch protein FliG [Tardibacter chloracetimidivorans]
MSEEAVAALPRHLSGTQKSAILMMLLGEDEAADLLKHLNPREVQNLGQAMYSIADVDQGTVNNVLDEFILAAREQTSLGLGTGPYVKNVFVKALGEEKAGSVLGRMSATTPQKGIELLDWMDARSISATIQGEHPQVIAAVLSHLDAGLAAEVLQLMPEDMQADMMYRVATLDSIQPDALAELERVMQKQIKANAAVRSATIGGASAAARIMNHVRGGADRRIIGELTGIDEDIGQTIQDQMFIFDNLLSLDDRSMQTLLRSVDNTLLVPALKGADERMRAKFLGCMSQRAAQTVQDELEATGPMRVSEVQDAQKRILAIARQLGESGQIMLGGSGDDYV